MAGLLIVGAMTKSAQFPFVRWLPAAMAAPTPVSALVHSSTLVTAGVFLLIRFFPVLRGIDSILFFLLLSAALTCMLAGMCAIVETDMKKVIALSTLSQLGTIMYRLAMAIPVFAFFHIISHALFKALLFIAAGILIHYHGHGQDLRSMGRIFCFPFTSSMLITGRMALSGMPFLAGFYSKDLIIEAQYISSINFLLVVIFVIGTVLTTGYSMSFLINVLWLPRLFTPVGLFQPFFQGRTMGAMLMLAHSYVWIGAVMYVICLLPNIEACLPLYLKLQAMFAMVFGGGLIWGVKYIIGYLYYKINIVVRFLSILGYVVEVNQMIASVRSYRSEKVQKNIEGGWIEGGQGTGLLLRGFIGKIVIGRYKPLYLNLRVFVFMISLISLYV